MSTPTIQIGSTVTPIGTHEIPYEDERSGIAVVRSGTRFEVTAINDSFITITKPDSERGMVIQMAYVELW